MRSLGRTRGARASAVLVAAWLLGALLGWGGPSAAAWVSDVSMVTLSALAAVCLLRAAVRRPRGRRRPLVLLGCAAGAWGLGEGLWGWYELVLGQDVPFPSVADVAYLSAAPLAGCGLLGLSRGVRQRSQRARTFLDGWLVAGSLLAASWDLLVVPTASGATGGVLGVVVAVAYPVTDVMLVTVALLVLRDTARAHRRTVSLVAAAMLFMAVADTVFSALELADQYHSGGVGDVGWVAAYLLLALAGISDDASAQDSSADRTVGKGAVLAPYVLVVTALAGVAVAAALGHRPGPVAIALLFSLGLALVVRQALTVLDNAALASLLELRERHFRSLVHGAKDVIVLCGRDLRATYVSPASATVLGLAPELVVGRPLWDLVHPEDLRGVQDELARVLDGGSASDGVLLRCRMASGDGWIDTESSIGDLRGDPSVAALVVTTRDVSDRTALEVQLRKLAREDPLTGLANRTLLQERLEHALAQRRPAGTPVGLLLLDLDGFKAVNDTYGHASGDVLLVQVAQRLVTGVRRGDTVARLGGDEFAVVLETWSEDDAKNAGLEVAQRLLRSLAEPVIVEGRELSVGASMGLVYAEPGVLGPDLLRQADFALYASKDGGRGRVTEFGPELAWESSRRTELAKSLRSALADGDLRLAYQPVVDLASGTVVGAEALARWDHVCWGSVSPTEFVPLAESTGMIAQLGHWALADAARQAARWQSAGLEIGVAVNVSVRQLGPEFVADVRAVLTQTSLAPSRLTLEITESVLVDDDRTLGALNALKALGVRLALDDFGTGWSSLSYLSRLPIDVLKLDASFVAGLGTSEAEAVSRTVIQLASELGLEVIAEGVETAEQRELLVAMGCTLAQGWLFGTPGPAEVVARPVVPAQRRAADRETVRSRM